MTKPIGTRNLRLRLDQFDLMVELIKSIQEGTSVMSSYPADVSAKRFTKKRVSELLHAVIAVYPEAGK